MFNSQFIEVGIGLVFVFLLMSIMVSGVNEVITSIFDHRGKQLKDALSDALKDPENKDWGEMLYKHPLIDSLKKSEKKLPSYIGAPLFAKTIIDIIIQEKGELTESAYANASAVNPMDKFVAGLETLKPSATKTLLLSFVNDANNDYDKLKANIEGWYETYMDRVSGWYKRKTKKILFVIGFVFAILMNVDTIRVSQSLWENTVLRESIVGAAQGYAANRDTLHTRRDTTFAMEVDKIKTGYHKLGMLTLPIGWSLPRERREALAAKYQNSSKFEMYEEEIGIFWRHIGFSTLVGWLFTGIAISFGAPIWFDVLNKLINLRHSVKGEDGKE